MNTRNILVTLALLFVVACGEGRLSPQGGTVTSVQGGNGLTGGGTGGAVTLNVVAATGGGLSVLADSVGLLTSCSSGEILKWGGSAWACSPDSGGITNSAGANVLMKSDGTNAVGSLWTDDGTTTAYNTNKFTVASASGNTSVAGTLATAGNFTAGDSTADAHTVNGRIQFVGDASSQFLYLSDTGTNYGIVYDSGGKIRFGGAATVGGAPAVASFEIDPNSAAATALGTLGVNGQLTLPRSAGSPPVLSWKQTGQAEWQVYQLGSNDSFRFWNSVAGVDSCILSTGSTLNCIGGMQENGAAVLSGAITNNVIPKGSSGNLVDSAITSGAVANEISTATNYWIRTGLVYGNTPDTSEPGFRSTRNATSPGTVSSNQWGFGYSTSTSDFIWDYFNGTTWSGPYLALTSSGQLFAGDTSNSVVANNLDVLTIGNTGTGQTGDSKTLARLSNTGTYDTTAGQISTMGIVSTVTATRSAGANTLNNYGAWLSASGAQVNRALITDAGDVFLHASSGTTGIGVAPDANMQLKVLTTNRVYAIDGENTPTAGTADVAAVSGIMNGTINTTGASHIAFAVSGVATTTRSSGANTLTNIGVYGSASGAQVNRALQTDSGDVWLNAVSGTTGIGIAPDATIRALIGQTTLATGVQVTDSSTGLSFSSSANFKASASGTHTDSANSSTHALLSGSDTFTYANVPANPIKTHSLYGADLSIAPVMSTGCSTASESGNSCPSYNQRGVNVSITSPSNAKNPLAYGAYFTVANNGTTTPKAYGWRADVTGTTVGESRGGYVSVSGSSGNAYGIDLAVSGSGPTIGINSILTSTGSTNTAILGSATGAGTTNTAGSFTASGASTNRALQTDAGDVYLNASSGTAGIGIAPSSSTKLAVATSSTGLDVGSFTNTSTANTTSGIKLGKFDGTTTTFNLTSNKTFYGVWSDVRGPSVAGCGAPCSGQTGTMVDIAAYFNAQGGNDNVSAFFDNGTAFFSDDVYIGSKPFSSAFTSTDDGDEQLHVGTSATGLTSNYTGLWAYTASATFNTTSGAITATSLNASALSSRSSGANNLTNRAVYADAQNGQVNYALYTDHGDNYLNATSGTTGIGTAPAATAKLKIAGGDIAYGLFIDDNGSSSTTNHQTIHAESAGTYDTTGGAKTGYALQAVAAGARFSGSNTLTNYAGYFDATGGQVNYAIYADHGDNYFNVTSGNTKFFNGPEGINNYGGTHLEWNTEWLTPTANLPLTVAGFGGATVGDPFVIGGAGGTGAQITSVSPPSGRVGVAELQTGTTTTGNTAAHVHYESFSFANNATSTFEASVAVPTLSNATDEYRVEIGFWDDYTATATLDGCFFEYDRGSVETGSPTGSVDKWEVWCKSNGTATNAVLDGTTQGGVTTVNTAISAATYQRLKIVVTGTSSAAFYVDGTLRATITTNIPNGATTRQTGGGISIKKSAGTVSRSIDVDQTRIAIDLNSARSP